MDSHSILILRNLVSARLKHLDEQILLTQTAFCVNHPNVCALRALRAQLDIADSDLVDLAFERRMPRQAA